MDIVWLALGAVAVLIAVVQLQTWRNRRAEPGERRRAMPAPRPGPSTARTGPASADDAFDVTLLDAGRNKIAVIKALRELRPSLGLKEAKDQADGAPTLIRAQAPLEEADRISLALTGLGAAVDVQPSA